MFKRKGIWISQPWLNLNIAMNDHKLPQLARALDNEEMRSLLSVHLARYMGGRGIRRLEHSDHIKKYCHPGPEALSAGCPELRSLVESILEGLAADPIWAGRAAPVCPVHGDLGLSKIFVGASRAFFIDFDGFCLSHAALDLSNFLVALKVNYKSARKRSGAEFFS